MRRPKILVATPIAEAKDYVLWDWLYHVLSFQYVGHDILLVDNSANPEYHKQFKIPGVKVLRVEPYGLRGEEALLRSQMLLREEFLNGDYDFFFSLECDLFPRIDIIQRLLSFNLPVVGAGYYIFKNERTIPISGTAFLHGDNLFVHFLSSKEHFHENKGGLRPTTVLGLGCLMIHRNVIEQVPFRIEKNRAGHSDAFFHEDLIHKGIVCYEDLESFCPHYNDAGIWTTQYKAS